ncbi:uncharacterized protein LOC116206669 isoform X2 [Punica granatum]|uniref:Uncharacterized protein LOC116206669 isoform X2 n=1 Tax=Punica granatum TaxID=22663 RepID=A0A218Y0R2_PUNGR|nr:uncharacterized protein LOC116206669 isoform X2 [Punica granatum]OWM90814.1 hypothetical protein CDL15_Pgr011574 [Punica granatum]
MDRWKAVLKDPVCPNSRACYRVAVSLCIHPASKTLAVPSVNAIFFNGDRVEGTRNPVIERLSDLQHLADVLVSKFGGSTNAWVIEASTFNGPFAVYKDFIPSVNRYGEPKEYSATGFPASASIISLLSKCIEKVNHLIRKGKEPGPSISSSTLSNTPKSIILGFSKGGTVLNQLVTELSSCDVTSSSYPYSIEVRQQFAGEAPTAVYASHILPTTKESFLGSMTDVHYVDVGLNSPGAYITDRDVISRISDRVARGAHPVQFFIHGTPRQWCDRERAWIPEEKDVLVGLLKSESLKVGGKLQVSERLYFSDRPRDLQMHFEIIEKLDVSVNS